MSSVSFVYITHHKYYDTPVFGKKYAKKTMKQMHTTGRDMGPRRMNVARSNRSKGGRGGGRSRPDDRSSMPNRALINDPRGMSGLLAGKRLLAEKRLLAGKGLLAGKKGCELEKGCWLKKGCWLEKRLLAENLGCWLEKGCWLEQRLLAEKDCWLKKAAGWKKNAAWRVA